MSYLKIMRNFRHWIVHFAPKNKCHTHHLEKDSLELHFPRICQILSFWLILHFFNFIFNPSFNPRVNSVQKFLRIVKATHIRLNLWLSMSTWDLPVLGLFITLIERDNHEIVGKIFSSLENISHYFSKARWWIMCAMEAHVIHPSFH